MTTRHNHRQRKKLHIGEYKELGFTVEIQFVEGLSDAAQDAFLDAFVGQVIEVRKLMYGGSFSYGFVCRDTRADASEEDRTTVREWLAQRSEVQSASVSELVDAWR